MGGKIGNNVLGILVALVLYVFVSGYYLHERQKINPLLQRNCKVPARCYARGQKIPKTIYRLVEFAAKDTSYSGNVRKRTLLYNPGYAQKMVTMEEAEALFVRNFPRRMVDAYRRVNPVYEQCKRDILCYAMMYVHGGVFLENDCWASELCKLIEPDDSLVLSSRAFPISVGIMKNVPLTGDFQRWWLVVAEKHPFLLQLLNAIMYKIENLNPMLFPTGREGGMHLTGGDIFTVVLKRMEEEGMTEFRIVCPNGNGLVHRNTGLWYPYKYPSTTEIIVLPKKVDEKIVGNMTPAPSQT